MHELVSNDARHPQLVVAGALPLVEDEVGLAEGDESPVLGGARGVVGDGGHVQLGQWVGDLGEEKQGERLSDFFILGTQKACSLGVMFAWLREFEEKG